ESFRVRQLSCRQRDEVRTLDGPAAHAALACLPGEPIQVVLSRMPDAASRERFAARLPAGVTVTRWHEGSPYYVRGRGRYEALAPGAIAQLTVASANTRLSLAWQDMTTTEGASLVPLT